MIRADNLLKATFGTYWRMVKAAWPFLFFVYLPINMLAQAFVPADAETFLDLKNSFRVESILDAILGIVAVAAAVRFAVLVFRYLGVNLIIERYRITIDDLFVVRLVLLPTVLV